MNHLLTSEEALVYQQTWNTYLIVTSPDKIWLRSMSFRNNSKFSRRLIEKINHSVLDGIDFDETLGSNTVTFSMHLRLLVLYVSI